MALFHDTCTAIVDRSTGRALTGEALAAAKALLDRVDAASGRPVHLHGEEAEEVLATRGWGICGGRVSKKSRFCRDCGTGAPRGWVKCPSCRRWIGNDAHFCPHCNHPLHPEERVAIAGGVWDRGAGVFAQRFECGEDERQLKDGIQIQEGTVALYIDGGREVRVLGPGRHTPEGTLRAINWFGNPPPRSVVLVASGDMVFTVNFPGLRSAEESTVSASADITLRFVPGKAREFLENFLKERRSVSADAVCDWLMAEAASAMKDIALQSTIEDLVKDPDRRPRAEAALSRALSDLLSRNGLSLVRVGAVEFGGPDFLQMQDKYAALDKARRELEFKRANLALMAEESETDIADSKARAEREAARDRDGAEREAAETQFHAKKEQETAEYLAQLAQEKDLAGIERSEEVQLALRASSGRLARRDAELEAAARLERDARETETLAHKLGLDLQLKDYTRDSLLKDAQAAAAVAAVKRTEREAEARTAAVIDGISIEAWVKRSEAQIDIRRKSGETEIDLQRKQREAEREHLAGLVEIKARNTEIKVKADRERAATVKGLTATELAALHEGDTTAQTAFLGQAYAETLSKLDEKKILAMQAANQNASNAYVEGEKAAAQVAAAQANAANAILQEVKTHKAELRQDLAAMRTHDEKIFDSAAGVAEKAAEKPAPIPPPPPPPTQQIIK